MFEHTGEKYVASLDVGTTTLRCQIINSKAQSLSQASTGMKLVYPEPGFVEIDPDILWKDVVAVIKKAILEARLKPEQITCLGLATQRGTFITWRKDSGKPFHNFITWKDMRSKRLVQQWNDSFSMRGLRYSCYLLYLLTRHSRWLAGSNLMLSSTQVTLRLIWVVENIPEIRKELAAGNVMYGTMETWLTYRLTGGRTYATDYSNASATGLFDPFVLGWSSWMHSILKVPRGIFPPLVPNDFEFGRTERQVLGAEIPIKCVMADQQSSMFGSCCFSGDILKVTLGTGCFLDVKTPAPHGSLAGIYPVVAYSLKGKFSYLAEGSCNDTGSLIQWALGIGLSEDPSLTSDLAVSVGSSDGVYFVPAFSGLGYPFCDDKAASGFLGIQPRTQKAHMMRAVLESIVYRIVLQVRVMRKEIRHEIRRIFVDGGVSKNDFVCQLLADLTGLPVERPICSEMSVMGVAFIAGLNSGIWKNEDSLTELRQVDKIFSPSQDLDLIKRYKEELDRWTDVVDRFKSWYT